jgi:uncharacterized membrane protein (DUF4010 family)
MQHIISQIPKDFINFLIVSLFSLVIGLSQRKAHPSSEDSRLFGTDRTFTFIGILGFILYIVDNSNHYLFIGGGLILSVFLAISYFFKIKNFQDFGTTTMIIALITYCLTPLVMTQHAWLYILVVVTVLVLTEMKETFISLSSKFEKEEFITLAKFLIITGIILPIVPDTPFVSDINLTPYKIWLAVVVISSISYFSYLLKKFVFKKSGIIVSGILGGLYSSTATTIILSKKSSEDNKMEGNYAAAIIFATAMMYLRILVLVVIFNPALLETIYLYFILSFIITILLGIGVYYHKRKKDETSEYNLMKDKNPLEFKVALIFTLLFVGFSFITHFTIDQFGSGGLNFLSYVVGLTDIDPFLINLFQGKFNVTDEMISQATIQAIISNNILKTAYAMFFINKQIRRPVFLAFLIIILSNILMVIIL